MKGRGLHIFDKNVKEFSDGFSSDEALQDGDTSKGGCVPLLF